jgi:23S rRNA G2445 N2-methylase RlmL
MAWEEVQIGSCRLIRGDCQEILPQLEPVDVLITDPPYGINLGRHAAVHERRLELLRKPAYRSYDDTVENLISTIIPALTLSLTCVTRGLIFCASQHIPLYPPYTMLGGIYIPMACGRNVWGFTSFVPVLLYGQAPMLQRGAYPTVLKSNVAAESVAGFPVPKPLPWMQWAVALASRPGETVLDPFIGSGTTAIACLHMGRPCIGIEIDPQYFDIACQRMTEAYRQLTLFPPVPRMQPRQEVLL